ncbi:nitrilase-related carbon-nitrogen hydrolase [Paraburkholderia aromaticivorans]|uniref:nitrilase-related carbon-nitrogen hydrolase n=1 Tax=Paraburkholderia aromaticivorans TaxID=2026199 RepID=UPI001455DC0E|nr:nitrilase-related carbon-nitrogen hydrolase [Paraburkholderia aromaticivorans]
MCSSTVPLLRVAAASLGSRPGDAPHNVARITDCLALAAEKDIGLVVFPETCIGGYGSMAKLHRAELDALAEPLDGPSIRAVADAVERSGVAAGVGFVERAADGRLFNSYVVCLPGGVRHCHRKLHAFEHRRISNGDRFTVFDTTWGVRVGILIGGDNYLVENMRMTALMGATLLIAPHRSDGANRTGDSRTQPVAMAQSLRRSLPARAGDNGMFVVFSEGGDVDDPEQSSGAGMIVDPCGRVLAESSARDALISADLDRGLIDGSAGQQWLTARRPELYGLLTRSGHRAADFEPRGVSSRGAIALSFAQVSRNRPIR